ncbi:MAG TPA: hypothetical protein VF444_00545 [Pseudonocardiaceae bacterium]
MDEVNQIDIDDPEVGGDLNGRITYRGQLYTGEAIEYGPDGHRIALTNFTDGVKDGIEKEWYPDGSPLMEGMSKHGSAVGEWRQWFPDGRLKQLNVFDDKGRHLSRKIWDENGNLIKDYSSSDPR